MLDAEERRQRRNDHADALQYALAGRRSGKAAAMTEHVAEQRAQGEDVAVIHGHDRGMPVYDFPCSCGRTIRGTDRDRGRRCTTCEYEESTIRKASMLPVPHAMLPEFVRQRCDEPKQPKPWQLNTRNPGPCHRCGNSTEDRCAYLGRGESPRYYCFPCAELRPWERDQAPTPPILSKMADVRASSSCGAPHPFRDGIACELLSNHTEDYHASGDCGWVKVVTSPALPINVVEVGGTERHHVTAPCDFCDQPRPLRPAVFGMDPVECCDACYAAHMCEPRLLYRASEPKLPTLREWLGDRVSEFGPWADVLREHPVPAGMIVAWHWDHIGPEWILLAADKDDEPGCGTYVPPDLTGVFDSADDSTSITCWLESLQMALFTRHPAVKPEPRKKPLRTWFGNEEEL